MSSSDLVSESPAASDTPPPSRRAKAHKENAQATPPPVKRKKTGDATRGPGYKVGFVGCGNMARSLVEGMVSSGESTIISVEPVDGQYEQPSGVCLYD